MSKIVPVYIADVDEALLLYTQVRLYSDVSPDGAFATLADTETIVVDVHTYYPVAASGTADTWYAWRLYNPTGPVSGDLSSPFQMLGVSMGEVRLLAAANAGMGFASETTAIGSTTKLVDDVLRDNGLSDTFLNASWIDRYSLDTTDRLRRMAVVGFDTADGGVVPLRAWSAAPQSGEAYAIYGLLPPTQQAGTTYSWDAAIRDGMKYCWYNDEVILLDPVTANDDRTNQISLDQVPWLQEDRIRSVYTRKVDDDGRIWQQNLTKGGAFWDIRDLGFGHRVLVLSAYPLIGYSVAASVIRQPDLPYRDADIVTIDKNLAAAATVMAAFRYLNGVPATKGQYAIEYRDAVEQWKLLYAPYRPKTAMVGS